MKKHTLIEKIALTPLVIAGLHFEEGGLFDLWFSKDGEKHE